MAMIPQPGQNGSRLDADVLRRLAVSKHLYALFDACDAPAVQEKMDELPEECATSLFEAEDLRYRDIGPWLVDVDETVLEFVGHQLADDPWGIFLVADAARSVVLAHTKSLLTVIGPDGAEMYFRYYDPRVLRAFVTTCPVAQRKELLGPLTALAVPTPGVVGEAELLLGLMPSAGAAAVGQAEGTALQAARTP